jgi:hypothetical protein
MKDRCRDCGRFLGELERMGGCQRCYERRESERHQRERIAAMPIRPWCPYPWERCICGDKPHAR